MAAGSVILAGSKQWLLLLPVAFLAWGLIGLALVALGIHQEPINDAELEVLDDELDLRDDPAGDVGGAVERPEPD